MQPDPRNVARLIDNLRGFEPRYVLVTSAVSDESGQLEFGVEPTGRYGGLGLKTGRSIVVRCRHINDALRQALDEWPKIDMLKIDMLKIDTEGVEERSVRAIRRDFLQRIGAIYIEAKPAEALHVELFHNRQYGSVRQMVRREE